MSGAHRYFIPAVRMGHAAWLAAPAVGERGELPAEIEVTRHEKGGGDIPSPPIGKTLKLAGPGDVRSIAARFVARTHPRHDVGDFEPNYFPSVELADADFAWRFTARPATADGQLLPWIVLVVLEAEPRADGTPAEFEDVPPARDDLPPAIRISARDPYPLPDLAQSWRWAHVQVTAEEGLNQSELEEMLRSNPERAISRLLCPRRLRAGTKYAAFVVPAFKLGVLAGLGQELAAAVGALEPAWTGAEQEVPLPYYYRWEFRTGRRGDFESLVRLLEPRDLTKLALGKRPVDCSAPGFGVPAVSVDSAPPEKRSLLEVEGALWSLDSEPTPWGDDAPGGPETTETQRALAVLLNRNDDARADQLVSVRETAAIQRVQLRYSVDRSTWELSFLTSEPAVARVEHGETRTRGHVVQESGAPAQDHQLDLFGPLDLAAPAVTHFLRIEAHAANGPFAAAEGTFVLLRPVMPRSTEIRDITVDVPEYGNEVTLSWSVAPLVTCSRVEYWLPNESVQSAPATPGRRQTARIAGLKFGRMYLFRIVVQRQRGGSSTSIGAFRVPDLPVVVPPLYGRWHAARERVDADGAPSWFRTLNLDPRHRIAAGLGADVVRKRQEDLMRRAWDELGAIESANDLLRRAQLGRESTGSMLQRLEQMATESFLMATAPVHRRLLTPDPDGLGDITVARLLATQTRIPPAAFDPALRHMRRPRGPIRRRQYGVGDRLLVGLASGQIEAAASAVPEPSGTVSFSVVSKDVRDLVTPFLEFTARPRFIGYELYVDLRWDSANVPSCTASSSPAGVWDGDLPAYGNRTLGPLDGPVTLTIEGANADGDSVSRSVVVRVAPLVELLAASGVDDTDSLTSVLRRRTSFAGNANGVGTSPIAITAQPFTHTEVCQGTGARAEVSVVAPPAVHLCVDTDSLPGGWLALTWGTAFATGVRPVGAWTLNAAELAAAHKVVAPLPASAGFELAADGAVASQHATSGLVLLTAPDLAFSAVRKSAGDFEVTWSTSAAQCEAYGPGDWDGEWHELAPSGTHLLQAGDVRLRVYDEHGGSISSWMHLSADTIAGIPLPSVSLKVVCFWDGQPMALVSWSMQHVLFINSLTVETGGALASYGPNAAGGPKIDSSTGSILIPHSGGDEYVIRVKGLVNFHEVAIYVPRVPWLRLAVSPHDQERVELSWESSGGPACYDFSSFTPGNKSNPLARADATFTCYESGEAKANHVTILAWSGFDNMLDCNHRTRMVLDAPCGLVELQMVHVSQPATLTAYDAAGDVVDSAVVPAASNVLHTLTLSGPSIVRIEIEAPQGDNALATYSCAKLEASGTWSGPRLASDTEIPQLVSAPAAYELANHHAAPDLVIQSATANVAPTLRFASATYNEGAQTYVSATWQVDGSGVTGCNVSWSQGTRATAGAELIGPLASAGQMEISCAGTGGSAKSTVDVEPLVATGATARPVSGTAPFCNGDDINGAAVDASLADALDGIEVPAGGSIPDDEAGAAAIQVLDEWLNQQPPATDQPPFRNAAYLDGVRDQVTEALQPSRTVVERVKRRLVLAESLMARFDDEARGDPLDPILWAPSFPEPMYEPLRDISQNLLLPGVEAIRANTVGLLKTNRRFMEAYLAGLNHEFASELLWREYPTDQRGSYFRQFWDVRERVRATDDAEKFRDIRPMHVWDSLLGEHAAAGAVADSLVLVVRGDLLKRYPATRIYAVEAVPKDGGNGSLVPALREYLDVQGDPPAELTDPAKRLEPTFRVTLPPDLTLFGFPLPEQEARNRFFIIEEHIEEPRFGLDERVGQALNIWDDLSWEHFDLHDKPGHYLDSGTLASAPADPCGQQWNATSSSAVRAWITLQKPVRIAMLGSDLMPAPRP